MQMLLLSDFEDLLTFKGWTYLTWQMKIESTLFYLMSAQARGPAGSLKHSPIADTAASIDASSPCSSGNYINFLNKPIGWIQTGSLNIWDIVPNRQSERIPSLASRTCCHISLAVGSKSFEECWGPHLLPHWNLKCCLRANVQQMHICCQITRPKQWIWWT